MEVTFGQLGSEALAGRAGKALLEVKRSLKRGQVDELRWGAIEWRWGLMRLCAGRWASRYSPTSRRRTAAGTARGEDDSAV